MIKKYNEYINEGIRDKMTPKSKEDIFKSLETLPPYKKLMIGSREGIPELIKQAIIEGADIHWSNDMALQLAISNKLGIDMIKFLHEHGADITEGGNYAIRYASELGQTDVVKYLLDNGANPLANDSYAIKIAQENGYSDVVDLFKEYGYINGGKINEGIRDKMTPKSDEDIDRTLKDYSPHEIFRLGIKNNMWHLVKRGIEAGVSVHTDNDAALRFACQDGNLEIVKYLIDKGANIHEFENDSLVRACYSGNLEVVKCLVDNGGDIHGGGIEKVLRAACSSGHPDIVEYLLNIGAKSRYITSSEVTHGEKRKKILELLDKNDK